MDERIQKVLDHLSGGAKTYTELRREVDGITTADLRQVIDTLICEGLVGVSEDGKISLY